MRITWHWAWLAFAALAAAGCDGGSPDGLPRERVTGKVTLDGQPLASGSITLVPTGFDGPPANAQIKDGAYSIARQDGPIPGAHSVRVFAPKPTGRKLADAAEPGTLIEETFETIPPTYNNNSKLTANVEKGGANNFDFELTGGIKTPPPPAKR